MHFHGIQAESPSCCFTPQLDRESCCYTQPTCTMFSKINATFPIKALFQLGSIHLPTLLQALLLFTSSLYPNTCPLKLIFLLRSIRDHKRMGEKSLAVPRQRLIIQSVHAFAAVGFVQLPQSLKKIRLYHQKSKTVTQLF